METSCSSLFARPSRAKVGGFSLVELLVALAISMVIVIGTTYVYLGTRETQRALFEKAFATETAHYALDVIGRDIENAGFYPSIRAAIPAGAASAVTSNVLIQSYANPVTASPPVAYDTPVFGCQVNTYKPTTPGCAAHTGSVDADTLVLNSYSNDASGLDIGNRADCLRQDSANDAAVNGSRRNAGHAAAAAADRPFLMPVQPLFVSNRYTLQPTTMQVEGQTISTFSLACNGNGVSTASNSYYPMVAGIDQLRFYYLVRASDAASSQFQRADALAATDWPNVVAVRVCLLARSLQAAKLQGSTSYTIKDCDDADQTFTDGVERRIFSQVFALKNHNQLLNPS